MYSHAKAATSPRNSIFKRRAVRSWCRSPCSPVSHLNALSLCLLTAKHAAITTACEMHCLQDICLIGTKYSRVQRHVTSRLSHQSGEVDARTHSHYSTLHEYRVLVGTVYKPNGHRAHTNGLAHHARVRLYVCTHSKHSRGPRRA